MELISDIRIPKIIKTVNVEIFWVSESVQQRQTYLVNQIHSKFVTWNGINWWNDPIYKSISSCKVGGLINFHNRSQLE